MIQIYRPKKGPSEQRSCLRIHTIISAQDADLEQRGVHSKGCRFCDEVLFVRVGYVDFLGFVEKWRELLVDGYTVLVEWICGFWGMLREGNLVWFIASNTNDATYSCYTHQSSQKGETFQQAV